MKLRNLATIYLCNNDKVLLMYRVGSRLFKDSLWAGIGGHFENDEINDPNKCIIREMFEETGITINDIKNFRLKYMTIRRIEDEVRQQYIYFADLVNEEIDILQCDEGEVHWIGREELLELHMSITNKECLKHYLRVGENNNEVYSGIVKVEEGIPSMCFIPLRSFSTNY